MNEHVQLFANLFICKRLLLMADVAIDKTNAYIAVGNEGKDARWG